jgi:P4 family phage/plasmid primase-like protien
MSSRNKDKATKAKANPLPAPNASADGNGTDQKASKPKTAGAPAPAPPTSATRVLVNGHTLTADERDNLPVWADVYDVGGAVLFREAPHRLDWLYQQKGALCWQAVAANKGLWRCWTGTHWKTINEGALHADVHWLLGGGHSASQIGEVVRTLANRVAVATERFNKLPIVSFEDVVLTIKERKVVRYQPGHRPEDYCTYLVPIRFLGPKEMPHWQAQLDKVLPDPDAQATLQEVFGLVLFPAVKAQVFTTMAGEANSGKSTFVSALQRMVGEERCSSVSMLDLSTDKHATAGLVDKLVNIEGEAEYMDARAEGLLKQITGGDLVRINPKFGAIYGTRLCCRMVTLTNSVPRFGDRTQGLWSRWVLIVFDQRIDPGTEVDMDVMMERFLPEHTGILHWALAGLARLLTKGTRASSFTLGKAALEVIESHRLRSNPFLEWFDEHAELVPGATEVKQELYAHYRVWCEAAGYKALASNSFWEELKKGVQLGPKPHRGPRTYLGIRLSK